MRSLPEVSSLQEALLTVIKSNKEDNYLPHRFVQIVANTKSSELVQVCTDLISSHSAYSQLSNALITNKKLLTLEDFVARYGGDWGFSEQAIETAKSRSESFDRLVEHKRYE